MPVYKNEKNGKWYFKTNYKNIDGETKYVTKRGFNTKAEATKALNDFHANKKDFLIHTNNRTFGEVYNEYFEHQKMRIKESSLLSNENKLKLHVLPYFENKQMNEFTVKDISLWQDKLLKEKNIL